MPFVVLTKATLMGLESVTLVIAEVRVLSPANTNCGFEEEAAFCAVVIMFMTPFESMTFTLSPLAITMLPCEISPL